MKHWSELCWSRIEKETKILSKRTPTGSSFSYCSFSHPFSFYLKQRGLKILANHLVLCVPSRFVGFALSFYENISILKIYKQEILLSHADNGIGWIVYTEYSRFPSRCRGGVEHAVSNLVDSFFALYIQPLSI